MEKKIIKKKVVQIAMGGHYNQNLYAVTEDGNIYAMISGSTKWGKLEDIEEVVEVE